MERRAIRIAVLAFTVIALLSVVLESEWFSDLCFPAK
jgi:hypothetical protein